VEGQEETRGNAVIRDVATRFLLARTVKFFPIPENANGLAVKTASPNGMIAGIT
jgi:hypothetical protein